MSMIYDVAVVGLGGMGSAAAATCARRGLRTVGIEQFSPAHALGSSHGRTRLIRQAYYENPAYVPMLRRAYDLWRALEAETGEELLRITGLLLAGRNDSPVIVGSAASARAHGIAIEELDARGIAQRFPMMRPLPDEVGVYEASGGVVFPEKTVDLMLRLAEKAGADLHFGRALKRIAFDDSVITIELDNGADVHAQKLVLAMGAWFQAMPDLFTVRLRIQRNVQAWFTPASDAFDVRTCPAFLIDRPGLPVPLYGMPNLGDGVKAAFHGLGPTTSAESLDREIHKSDVAPIQAALNMWMPGAGFAFREASACMYSLTPDEQFVIGLRPGDARVVLAGGFSGHGFKFVPVVGEIVADLVENGTTSFDIGFLSPNRFVSS